MEARRALLKRLAGTPGWEEASRAAFGGESWLESRNTTYRLLDGVCVDVLSRDARRADRARTLVGMRLVGWLAGPASLFTTTWSAGAFGVLWRPRSEGADEALAMTSSCESFACGPSSARLQALHDGAPPADSQTFRRGAGRAVPAAPRPRLPSSSYASR